MAVTRSGLVEGRLHEGVHAFLGIAYGSAPSRFAPPGPPDPWPGPLDASRYGCSCPQPPLAGGDMPAEISAIMGVGEAQPQSESCLFLNVWTPGVADRGLRPVMVLLHGGGHTLGDGSAATYDGSSLARRGDVVVITLNHRLGAFGYLYVDHIAPPEYAGSGNAGTLDIVQALRWVQDNAAAFGGDPGCVTVFGESGGGQKVSTLLAAPAAAGLFHRAVVQSGAMLRSVETGSAIALTEAVMDKLGASTFDELQAVPTQDLLDAQTAVAGVLGPLDGSLSLGPVADGVVLKDDPYLDAAPDVPLLIGTTRDEMSLFLFMLPGYGSFTEDETVGILGGLMGERSTALFADYKALRPTATPTELAVAVGSDRFRFDSVRQAERKLARGGGPVFMYLFSWETPVVDGRLGAAHAVDLGFVFDNVAVARVTGDDPARQQLADVMSDAWIAFARNGDPNHPGLPPWPAYSTANRATMVFDSVSAVQDDPSGRERQAWERRTARS